MFETIDEIKRDPILMHIDKLLFNTDIHGGFITYEQDSGFVDSGIYFVGSIDPLSKEELAKMDPAQRERKIKGNPSTFYPHHFAIKITNNDPLSVFDKIAEFCHNAEMVRVYFGLEGVKVPKEMPLDDLIQLKRAVLNSHNKNITACMREAVVSDLKKGIKNYKNATTLNEISQGFKNMFKSKDAEIADFIRTYKAVNYETVREEDVDSLISCIKMRDEDIQFVLSDPIEVNTGLEEVENGHYDPYGYAQKNYTYRELYFKRADEYIVQDALNTVRFSFKRGKGHDISLIELSKCGPICNMNIPENYMPLVDNCLKQWGIKYSIDYGYLSKPDNRTVPILYLEKDKKIMQKMASDICRRYAGDSYVHAYDRSQFYQTPAGKEVTKNWKKKNQEVR